VRPAAPTATSSAPGRSSSAIRLASATAAGTPHGRAAHATLGLIDHSPSQADVARWYFECGQAWEPETKASVTRAGLKAAIKGLDPNRKIALTTIDALAAEGKPWAMRAVAKAETDNLDTAVKANPHAFTLTELFHGNGATVDDLIELPEINPETRLASLRLLREWAAAENQRAQSNARIREAARKTPRKPLAEVSRHVADMVHDEPTGTIVDGLIYEQMVIHWVGDGGTYKTFTVLSLACSVAAGRDFTHQLKVPAKPAHGRLGKQHELRVRVGGTFRVVLNEPEVGRRLCAAAGLCQGRRGCRQRSGASPYGAIPSTSIVSPAWRTRPGVSPASRIRPCTSCGERSRPPSQQTIMSRSPIGVTAFGRPRSWCQSIVTIFDPDGMVARTRLRMSRQASSLQSCRIHFIV
jgi:AAA domain